MTAIATAAQALAGLLRAAEEGGPPMPASAEVLKWAPYEHPGADDESGGIEIHANSLADLTEWATWLDEPIDDTGEPYQGAVSHRVFGMAGPVPVKIWTRVPVAEQVSA